MSQNPNPSKLDPHQIQQRSFDEATDRIRVDATSSIEPGSMEVVISEADDSIVVYGNDGTTNRALKTDASGELQVDVLSSALPTGAATESKQDTGNTSLASIDTKLTNGNQLTQITDGAGVVNTKQLGTSITSSDVGLITQTVIHGHTTAGGGSFVDVKVNPSGALTVDASGSTVSVTSSALPTGASTSAKQDTGNTSLSNIDGKLPALSGGRVPVDGSGVTQPVSGTFWQATQPVSAASLPLPTGAATAAKQDTGNTSLSNIDGKLPALSGGRVPVDGSGVTQPVSMASHVPDSSSLNNSLSALNATAEINTNGFSTVSVQVTGTFVGTNYFEATIDGTNWTAIYMILTSGMAPITNASNAYASGTIFTGKVNGYTKFRVRMAAYTSGTAVVSIVAAASNAYATVVGTVAARLNDGAGTSITSGQKTAAGSIPVVLASDQTLPLPSGAATETTLSSINTKTPSLGQATMANSSPVTLASDQSALPPLADITASGTINALNGTVSIVSANRAGVSIQVSGTFTATLAAEISNDNTNWYATACFSSAAVVSASPTTANMYYTKTSGAQYFRVRASSYTSGTLTIILVASAYTPSHILGSVSARQYDGAGTSITAGQKTMTGSMPVVLASDQASIPVVATGPTTVGGTLTGSTAADTSRAVLYGKRDDGTYAAINATAEGHLEAEIHGPRLPFGSIHTEELTAIFQTDAVYGLNASTTLPTTSGTGSVTASDSAFVCSTGTTVNSQAVLQSRKRLRYVAGQGMVGRFTAAFTSPVANSYQIAGLGHAEDGLYVGYQGTSFGILYVNRGVREVRTLTVSTASTTNENITVTLAGTGFSVAVTNSGSKAKTAYEISLGTYTGWKAEQVGETVVFVADSAGAKAGTFSITASTAVGSFATTKTGVASTDSFVAQSSWNGDKLDGTGASGVTIDPTKLNVFQIDLQFLGAGTFTVKAEIGTTSNDPRWITLHTFRLPNTLTATNFGNPSFPFTMAAYSTGSTTNLTVKCGSFAGFIEGHKRLHGPRLSYFNPGVSVGSANYTALMTIRNTRYYGGRSNQGVINIISVLAAQQHNNVSTVFLIKNATLSAGTPSFAQYHSTSIAYQDQGATQCTFTNDQLVWSGSIAATSNIDFTFGDEITLQPGETLTIAAKTNSGTGTILASLNTREDQ